MGFMCIKCTSAILFVIWRQWIIRNNLRARGKYYVIYVCSFSLLKLWDNQKFEQNKLNYTACEKQRVASRLAHRFHFKRSSTEISLLLVDSLRCNAKHDDLHSTNLHLTKWNIFGARYIRRIFPSSWIFSLFTQVFMRASNVALHIWKHRHVVEYNTVWRWELLS